jgi:hypothetical protein
MERDIIGTCFTQGGNGVVDGRVITNQSGGVVVKADLDQYVFSYTTQRYCDGEHSTCVRVRGPGHGVQSNTCMHERTPFILLLSLQRQDRERERAVET